MQSNTQVLALLSSPWRCSRVSLCAPWPHGLRLRMTSKHATVSLLAKTSLFISLWYVASGCTLFGNKHIMSTLKADPNLLAMSQMTCTALFGALKMYSPILCGNKPLETPLSTQTHTRFMTDMVAVGLMRAATVVLGLVSLKYVAVSFTETVKSSAPFFTVLFARIMLKEKTPLQVTLTLIPVVVGLALTTWSELSYNFIGFAAAVANNCIDCIQNVFSKKLLSSHYNYINLQFYTSVAALVMQMPVMLYVHLPSLVAGKTVMTYELAIHLLINGACFHMQSVLAYAVMGLISPVTQSVCNTLKRALLIWLSVLYFGNTVTPLSAFGTAMCISGVFLYNHVRRKRVERGGVVPTSNNYQPVPTTEEDSADNVEKVAN